MLLKRLDALIDFDHTLSWPAERGEALPQSVRWSGWVRPLFSGKYRLHVETPGAQVKVANRIVAGSEAPPNATVDMKLGTRYPIAVSVESLRRGETGQVRLEWTTPLGVRYTIPRELLYLPIA